MSSGKKVFFASTNALFHSYKSGTPSSVSKDKPTSASKLKTSNSVQNIPDSKTFLPPSTPRSIMKKTNLRRSRSAISISTPRKDIIATDSTPVKTSPVTHYCSPRTARRKLNVAESSAGNSKQIPSTPECFNKVYLETPSTAKLQSSQNQLLNEESSHLTVGIRVRPLNSREENEPCINKIVRTEGNEVRVLCESNSCHNFTYDNVFSPSDSQEIVFSTFVQPLLENAFRGYNACLFAYGQTGSGKSYSMMGVNSDSCTVSDEAGIIPRFCHELFERVASLEDSRVPGVQEKCSAKIEISYFEIYNEKIHDLLNDGESSGKRGNALKVREHPIFGPYVVDLTVHEVSSFERVQNLISMGSCQRASACTAMNDESSRSHSIFSIILSQTQLEDSGIEGVQNELSRCSKISLVDLAGSERIAQSCTSLDRLREGVHINKSLLTLGKVITALAEAGCSKRKIFIPYRDSVLTWLLRESLGGNSRTSMLATISPVNIHLEETLATLRYACQAKNIVNTVRVNEDPKDRIIRELRTELQKHKSSSVPTISSNDSLKVRLLQEKLSSTQEKLAELEKCYKELEHFKDMEGVRKLEDENVEAKESIINNLKEKLKIQEEEMEKQRKEIKELRLDMEEQNSFMEEQRIENEELRLELNEQKREMKGRLEEMEKQRKEIKELRLDMEEQNSFMEEQRIENEELRLELNEQKREMKGRLEEVEARKKEIEELKMDVEDRMVSLNERQREIDEQRFQIDEEKEEIAEQRAKLEEKFAAIDEEKQMIDDQKFQLEEEKMKIEEQLNDLKTQKSLLEVQQRGLKDCKIELSMEGADKEKLKEKLKDLHTEIEEQRRKIGEQEAKMQEMTSNFEETLAKKLDKTKSELKLKHELELKRKLNEQREEIEGSKRQSEILLKKYEEKVEEIEEMKLSTQIELWKKLEIEKEEVSKTKEKYETEVKEKVEEHKKEMSSLKEKHQTDLNRKLEEVREQMKQKSEMDFAQKLQLERQRFETELKKISSALEKECCRSETSKKDVKKLEKQIQLLRIDLESKSKLLKELSKIEDEGFEDYTIQPNDYEKFSKEIIKKFEKLNSAVINFSNNLCDDSPDDDRFKVQSEKSPAVTNKDWLESINLQTSRRSSISTYVRSPTRVSIRTLPVKKTVRFLDVSSL